MSAPQPRFDAAQINQALADRMLDVCLHLFPNGRKSGAEFHIGDLTGAPGKSLSTVIEGDKAGTWCDFAAGDKGGPLDLWMGARNLAFPEALREAGQWLGIAPTTNGTTHAPQRAKASNGTHAPAPDWSKPWAACVARATDERLAPIAKERGLSMAFLRYAAAQGWLGFYGENVAFPVVNEAGTPIACHYRLPDRSWRYEPKGCGTHPLVIGEPSKSGNAWVFESQWDALSVLDALAVHDDADSFTDFFGVVVTRGAGNGQLASAAANGCRALVAWPQNDTPDPRTGKVPSEGWVEKIVATAPASVAVRRVQTPPQFEDAGAWCKAAQPSREDVLTLVTDAENCVLPPAPLAAPASNGSEPPAALESILAARRFNAATPPPKPRPIFRLDDAVFATPGNIQVLSAQAKAGKTALLGAMIASTLPEPTGDTLGVRSSNPDGAAVIHFDTEQSPYDHYAVIMLALRRAGCAAPDWLRSYRLADVGINERMGLLRYEMEAARKAHGAIHSVFLDGVADLCHDPNNPEEAFALVANLHKLAIDYDTTIVCVLHENPGSETGKTRGHLGSQLERKAETNLRMSKDGDAVTVVFTERARHAHVPREHGPRFAWNDDQGMHLSVETTAATKTSAKREDLRDIAVEVFRDIPAAAGLTWEQLHQRIEATEGLKRSGARKKFAAMKTAGVIRQHGEKYRLA